MTPPVTSITTSHNLPPLPQNLSTKLLKTINPQTGNCIHHPKVQLCELIQNNTRWVVRRKICYKCGISRPINTGGGGSSRHRPGVSVVNPSSRKFDNLDESGRGRGRMRRSRSMSVDRNTSGRRSRSVSIDRINGSSSSDRKRSTSSTSSHNHHNASATSNMSRRSRSHSLSSRQRSIANTTFSRQESTNSLQRSQRSNSLNSRQHSRQRSHSVTSSHRSRSTSSNNNNRQRRHSEVLNESIPLLTNIAQSNINSIMMSPSTSSRESRVLDKSSRELIKNEREGKSSRNLEGGLDKRGHKKQNSSSYNINSPPNKDEQQHSSPLEKYNPPVSTIGGNHTNIIEPASVCGGTINGGVGDTNRVVTHTHDNKKRHSYHGAKSRRDDFEGGSTPKEKIGGGLVYPHTAPEPANHYTEEKKTRGSNNKRHSTKEKKRDSGNLGPLTIPDLTYEDNKDDDHIEPSNKQHTQSINNFNESDPIISIPQINLSSSSNHEMPPPPPRTIEEMEHHQARLEMRRQSIRKQREINRKKRDGIVKRIKNGDADIDNDGEGKDRKGDKKSDVVGTKDKRQDKRQSLGVDRGRSARWDRQERLVTTATTSNIDRSGRSGRSSRSRDPPQERLVPPSSSSRRRCSSVNLKTGRRRSSSVDIRQKRTSEEEVHPSEAALALLSTSSSKPERRRSRSSFDIRDERRGSCGDPPPQETAKERRQSTKINKPSTKSNDDIHHPSAAAMALLEKSNKKKKSSPERSRRQHSSANKKKEQQATNEDEDNSETSSISSASAKDYPTNEHVRQHPELEGVELPHIPVSRRSSSKPPADVTVDRSQSNSRSKSRSREDPPDNLKKGSTSSSSRRVSSSRALVATTQEDKKKRDTTKSASLKGASSKQRSSRSTTSRRRRSHDDHEDFEDHVTTTDMNKTTSDLTRSLSAALAASSSRKARRRASSKSMSTSGKVWDVQGNEIISKDRPRLNRSVSASCQGRHKKDDVTFPMNDSNKDGKKKKQRSRSVTNPTTKERSGDKSHSTKSTLPESLSSQELFTKRQSDEGDDEYVETPTSIQEDKDVEPEQPMVIYKKRAKKRKDDDDESGTQHTKPIGVLYCSSSDEKSAASSISNTSTIEESYASTVDYGGRSSINKDVGGDDDNVKDRAKAALHDVKGGAKQFAKKGRGALGGLKGTSRKWQSALFM